MIPFLFILALIFAAFFFANHIDKKIEHHFSFFSIRFMLLLIGIVTAAWTINEYSLPRLIYSSLLIGYGAGFDRLIRLQFYKKAYKPHSSMMNLKPGQMKIKISSVDYAPSDLYDQIPFEAEIIRRMPGPDRPDYWLAKLTKPLLWLNNGKHNNITHVILSTRFVGVEMMVGIQDCAFGIAYVVDDSITKDKHLKFRKCEYVAIGVGNDVSVVA